MPYNIALISALWGQMKTLRTTIAADVATLMTDLAAMEVLRSQVAAAGGSHVAEWQKQDLSQLTAGYAPYVLTPGGPVRITVFAAEPTAQRDLSQIGDRRPMSAIDPALT